MLTLTLSQLKQLYQQELPELYQLANETTNETDFKNNLDKFLSLHPQAESNTGKQIRLLINYDGRSIHELSTEQDMSVQTFSLLHRFLTGNLENTDMATDLFIDLFYLFKRLGGAELPPLSMQRVRIRSQPAPGLPSRCIVRLRLPACLQPCRAMPPPLRAVRATSL